ncbi:hypothetical protein GOP47_0013167 [Adiantum capillus-veneris]|uniref:DSBA-like thioredoxin domain-containing protein n=1 Tax=Adiantum capillus-veneris TaxID=13818 RepID=A0A9D4ZFI9_ADICA|nr:hypothetical protein GOP47_0013167 [Adiantum capillus-veneris]
MNFVRQVHRLSTIAQRTPMAGTRAAKPLIHIDVTSDTVCPWCFVGKRNLEKAMDASRDKYNFEVKWHPFLLNPNADTKGVGKLEYYKEKFGKERAAAIIENMTKVFQELGLNFSIGGLTGSTLDSHRLIALAGRQGYDKQNALVEELFCNYFTQEKYIGDRQVLLEAAAKVQIDGAEAWLNDSNAGIDEIQHDLEQYAKGVSGVPYFLISGQQRLSGAQPPASFLKAFELASST